MVGSDGLVEAWILLRMRHRDLFVRLVAFELPPSDSTELARYFQPSVCDALRAVTRNERSQAFVVVFKNQNPSVAYNNVGGFELVFEPIRSTHNYIERFFSLLTLRADHDLQKEPEVVRRLRIEGFQVLHVRTVQAL